MDREKRLKIALGVYAMLGLLIWTTMSNAPIQIGSVQISLRNVCMGLLTIFVIRTLLHWKAGQIQEESETEAE